MSDEIQDSSWVQLESVIRFAKSKGWEFNGRSFTTNKTLNNTTIFFSFNRMQKAHNQSIHREHKIVLRSSLQYHKKSKSFKTDKNKVKFI